MTTLRRRGRRDLRTQTSDERNIEQLLDPIPYFIVTHRFPSQRIPRPSLVNAGVGGEGSHVRRCRTWPTFRRVPITFDVNRGPRCQAAPHNVAVPCCSQLLRWIQTGNVHAACKKCATGRCCLQRAPKIRYL